MALSNISKGTVIIIFQMGARGLVAVSRRLTAATARVAVTTPILAQMRAGVTISQGVAPLFDPKKFVALPHQSRPRATAMAGPRIHERTAARVFGVQKKSNAPDRIITLPNGMSMAKSAT